MIQLSLLDRRPILIALAGPNGAGKSTFYSAYLQDSGLRLVNADVLARDLGIGPYEAASLAGSIRQELLSRHESFVFETVFSDPVGDKLAFLKQAEVDGYTVIMFFIGNSGPHVSQERIGMRVAKGGHDVPQQKLIERYPRTLANLASALRELPAVWVYDNDDLNNPFRLIAVTERGRLLQLQQPVPAWLQALLQP